MEAFQKSREDTIESAFVYYLLLVIINVTLTVFSSVAAGIENLYPMQIMPFRDILPAILFGILIVTEIGGVFIAGAWLHIFVWLSGGRKGYIQTLRTLLYGSTPRLLLGWIPVIGSAAGIWGIILGIIGIRELHEISTTRAIIAMTLALAILLIIIMLYIFVPLFLIDIPPPLPR